MLNRRRSIHVHHVHHVSVIRTELLIVPGQNVARTVIIVQHAYDTDKRTVRVHFLECSKQHSVPPSVAVDMPISIGIKVLQSYNCNHLFGIPS